MGLFAEDLKRWIDRGSYPRDSRRSTAKLRFMDVPVMFWRYAGVWPTAIFRMGSWCTRHGIRILPTIFERLNLVLFGIEISSSIPVGPGLYIAHPVGCVIMARRIGANASIISAVTLGMRETHDFPTLGDGVVLGAGARILGGISLGDGCTVGANAVVIHNVPAGATVVGIPARVVSAVKTASSYDALSGLAR